MNLLRTLTNYKYRKQLDLHEIHTYVDDLNRVTMLRDKTSNEDERKEYDKIINCMQLVLQFLNKQKGK